MGKPDLSASISPDAVGAPRKLKPWQVDHGPEEDLRSLLSGTEARVRALGLAVAAIAPAVLWWGGWATLTPAPVAEGWDAYRWVAPTIGLALAAVGGVGLLFLQSWGRWALMPLLVFGALGAASWTADALKKDTATPEANAASTPEGRGVIWSRGGLWIVAAALPALLVSRRRTRAACSADYRFAVARTARHLMPGAIFVWAMTFLAVGWGLWMVEADLRVRMPTGLVNPPPVR